ncbi:methyltransferase domain-containing protein [Colletotrichum musicola]|uniref:Methyltransferase domain-containing protein n=1 Tax=Colletotrichum musicola TaxID=2175873 RepID=A0A8H6U9U3_9PEZI|nr:methyltransferase domain-containing protein [Colletotrichum musicola]
MSATSDAPAPATGAQSHVQNVEAVDVTDYSSSERGESIASSKTSIVSSIYNFRVENGRTYHRYKEGTYLYPNDERESDRLDLQHELFLLTLDGKLGLSPPNEDGSSIKRVLDVGTGTGLWAIDFGETHPSAEVIGVDLSPPQAEVPPNVTFEVDDIEEPWLYSLRFDYIHSRMMTSSIADWKKYFQNCFDHLEPGGYLELQEIDGLATSDDGTLKEDCSLQKGVKLLRQACEIFGRPFQSIPALVDIMKDVGFVDVVLTRYKWPTNPWPKDPRYKMIGEWSLANNLAGIEAWYMAPFTRALNWKKEEVQVFLVDVRKDLKDRSMHAYIPVYVIHGRKPEEGSSSQE